MGVPGENVTAWPPDAFPNWGLVVVCARPTELSVVRHVTSPPALKTAWWVGCVVVVELPSPSEKGTVICICQRSRKWQPFTTECEKALPWEQLNPRHRTVPATIVQTRVVILLVGPWSAAEAEHAWLVTARAIGAEPMSLRWARALRVLRAVLQPVNLLWFAVPAMWPLDYRP